MVEGKVFTADMREGTARGIWRSLEQGEKVVGHIRPWGREGSKRRENREQRERQKRGGQENSWQKLNGLS